MNRFILIISFIVLSFSVKSQSEIRLDQFENGRLYYLWDDPQEGVIGFPTAY